jgi:hyperosmotically inducible periplasmic protein
VRHALSKTRGLDSTGITIVARVGKVTLTGSVLDALQIDMAGKSSASTAGVKSVDNRVSLREVGS